TKFGAEVALDFTLHLARVLNCLMELIHTWKVMLTPRRGPPPTLPVQPEVERTLIDALAQPLRMPPPYLVPDLLRHSEAGGFQVRARERGDGRNPRATLLVLADTERLGKNVVGGDYHDSPA